MVPKLMSSAQWICNANTNSKQCAADRIAFVVNIDPPHDCMNVWKFGEYNKADVYGWFVIDVTDPPMILCKFFGSAVELLIAEKIKLT